MRRRIGCALSASFLAALLALPSAASSQAAEFLGSYLWRAEDHNLGGFSGLELSADGSRFVAISDRGGVVEGTIERNEDRIIRVTSGPPVPLPDHKGQPLRGWRTDAEGLAGTPGETIYVSFEGGHRVWAYPTLKQADRLPRPEAFSNFQGNSGLESLALDRRGHIYAIPERSGKLTRPFPVWRYDGQWTQPFGLRRDGGFLPVGADFGPDDALYLLEREFNGFGFKSRVRRFVIENDQVVAEQTLLSTSLLRHDNLEGLGVWQDEIGDIRITMISDDNFRALQRTEFVEYRITVPLP
ncbi:esterase-like activity of phytase family protein [Thalassococcus lentus]|uniref:Esterase-like activity of phytase family protein n=1 Tax=Thalassococcus lentus TaxID=1210524 RepID=A0ABT4XNN0_9RHOB|nr:esterase-like activity of phytase family protein [Thalassococcus lentus]MDA7423530.1 esterase-like activity of phytase family protein [Thalassococcus lentus]